MLLLIADRFPYLVHRMLSYLTLTKDNHLNLKKWKVCKFKQKFNSYFSIKFRDQTYHIFIMNRSFFERYHSSYSSKSFNLCIFGKRVSYRYLFLWDIVCDARDRKKRIHSLKKTLIRTRIIADSTWWNTCFFIFLLPLGFLFKPV